ncbi:MAG: hypothetical protein Q8L24_00595 [bacterium]|nr:hypothetical protein [bacterium]
MSDKNGVWVVIPNGDAIQCVGCQLVDLADDGYGAFTLQLISAFGTKHNLVTDKWWSGKNQPTKPMSEVRERVTQLLLTSKGKPVNLKEDAFLMRRIRKLEKER